MLRLFLYELGANKKIVRRIPRHAKPHVTKERYIKAFDPAVLAPMKSLGHLGTRCTRVQQSSAMPSIAASVDFPSIREGG
jgi:hypothetical protein